MMVTLPVIMMTARLMLATLNSRFLMSNKHLLLEISTPNFTIAFAMGAAINVPNFELDQLNISSHC